MDVGKSVFGGSQFGKTDAEKEQERRDKEQEKALASPPPTMNVDDFSQSFAEPTAARSMELSITAPSFTDPDAQPNPVGTGTAAAGPTAGPIGGGTTGRAEGFPGDDDDPTAGDKPNAPIGTVSDQEAHDRTKNSNTVSNVVDNPVTNTISKALGVPMAVTRGILGITDATRETNRADARTREVAKAKDLTGPEPDFSTQRDPSAKHGVFSSPTDISRTPGLKERVEKEFRDFFGGDVAGTSAGTSGTTDASGVSEVSEEGHENIGGQYKGNPNIQDNNLFGPDPAGPDDGASNLDKGELVMKKANAAKFSPEARKVLASGNLPQDAVARIETALFG